MTNTIVECNEQVMNDEGCTGDNNINVSGQYWSVWQVLKQLQDYSGDCFCVGGDCNVVEPDVGYQL